MTSKSRFQSSVLVPSVILAAAILACIETLTLQRLKLTLLQDPGTRTTGLELGRMIPAVVQNLRMTDWTLLVSLAALLVWMILREARGRKLSAELARILESDKQTLLLLGIVAAAAGRFYLAPGQFALGDAPCHMSRVWLASESFSDGHWPFWSFFNYAGFPLLQFYGPLFFVLTGAIANVVGNVEWTTKALLFLLHVGSAFPVYGWVRSIGASRAAAMVAGIAYVLTFQHTHTVVWTGALPVALVYFFFPVVLLAVEKVFARASGIWVFVLPLSAAGLILSHNGYAAYAIQLALLYVLLRWTIPGAARISASRVLTCVLSMGAGVLLCLGFLWPIVAEGKWVYQPMEAPILVPGWPTLEFFKKLFIWRNLYSGWTVAYMGLSLLGFAAAGGYLVWRKRSDTREMASLRAVAIVAVFALLCAARAGRVANLALPFVVLLAGMATQFPVKAMTQRITFVVLAILVLDLGPTTIQSPYRTDRQFLRDGLEHVADVIGPHRALVGYASESGMQFYHWGYYEGTGLIQPTGFFPQGAPHSLNSITAMVDALNTPDETLTTARMDGLYLWDVGCLVVHARDRFVEPNVEGTQVDRTGIPLARVSPASPVIFSERVAVAVDDSLAGLQYAALLLNPDQTHPSRPTFLRRMSRWVERMGIDREKGRADVIFLAAGEERPWPPAGWEGREEPGPYVDGPSGEIRPFETTSDRGDPQIPDVVEPLSVERYTVDMRDVSITCVAPGEGYLRLAFSWYPTVRVLVDGRPVTPRRSVLGAMVIPTDGGKHTIELTASQTKTRLWAWIIGIGAGLLCALVAAKSVS